MKGVLVSFKESGIYETTSKSGRHDQETLSINYQDL